MTWYKIVETNNGILKTLFHGINRSRVLTTGEWMKANIKDVRDGSSQTYYKSGFHILRSYEECVKYLERFIHKDNKIIVACKAINVWSKTHSKANVYLAEYIYIEDNR